MAQSSSSTNEDTETQQRVLLRFSQLKVESPALLLKNSPGQGQLIAKDDQFGHTRSMPTSYY